MNGLPYGTINAIILCPPFNDPGGVAFYYRLVKKYFDSNRVSLNFYHTGKYPGNSSHTNRVYKTIVDVIVLGKLCSKYDLVIFNPSLDPKAVIRDGFFHFVVKRLHQKKTIVFFHGWKQNFEAIIDCYYGKIFFKHIFNANRICVLSKSAKNKLISWGYNSQSINTETTVYEYQGTEGERDILNILFLSRFTRQKGCIEAIQSIEILIKQFPKLKLYMVGDGEMTAELRKYVMEKKLSNNVFFTGYLHGKEKTLFLKKCSILIFPTYSEGMPITILESMGMGLAIVTRPVGGIPDIITEGENGFLIDSHDPNEFASVIKKLLQDPRLLNYISNKNFQTAKDNFEIRNVVKRLERLYLETAQ